MVDPSIPSELCTSCGLCCNGALFDYGPLDDDERDTARRTGMRVIEAEDETAFGLPCPQLDGCRCQIYLERPRTCRAYRCETLRAAEDGKLSMDGALARIISARAALEKVLNHLPRGATVCDARRWRREAGQAAASSCLATSPELMIALGLLDLELDRHFRKAGQRQIMPRED